MILAESFKPINKVRKCSKVSRKKFLLARTQRGVCYRIRAAGMTGCSLSTWKIKVLIFECLKAFFSSSILSQLERKDKFKDRIVLFQTVDAGRKCKRRNRKNAQCGSSSPVVQSGLLICTMPKLRRDARRRGVLIGRNAWFMTYMHFNEFGRKVWKPYNVHMNAN